MGGEGLSRFSTISENKHCLNKYLDYYIHPYIPEFFNVTKYSQINVNLGEFSHK